MKTALITGISGQDGSYLTEFLLEKGYEVHGMVRRALSSTIPGLGKGELEHLENGSLTLHSGDLENSRRCEELVALIQPDEIYNLGAQSDIPASFDRPEHTANVNALGTLRMLEAIRLAGLTQKSRFYQASTSELFGKVPSAPQNEETAFHPRSPYGVSKLFAYWSVVNYREVYGLYACNGILFNHESPRRGGSFVTRKITQGLSKVALGIQPCLYLGNLSALRDWGHARDYIEMQWLMLQQKLPQDYVVSTGKVASVRDFVNLAANELGISLEWFGRGVDEFGRIAALHQDHRHINVGDTIIKVNKRFYRPVEVNQLIGDSSLAKEKLRWSPKTSLSALAAEMIRYDFDKLRGSL